MSATLAVGIAQFAPGPDRAANLDAIERLARLAAGRGARLVVLPEYSSYFGGELGPHYAEHAEPLDGPFASALGALARELDVFLVAGLITTVADPARFANTVVAVSPAGDVVARYGKVHLYDAFGVRESDWMEAGAITGAAVFDADGFAVGLQTCYDIRFPEVSRTLVDAGAEVLVVPAEWVRGPLKEHHWRTLLTARAIENTAFAVAADQIPPVGVGVSLVIDPMGVELAGLGESEGVAVAWLERARLDEVRAKNPALALRRFTVAPR